MTKTSIVNAKPSIITDDEGLSAHFVEIPVEKDIIPVYCAFPERGEYLPILLVIQEIFGINEHIQDVCRRVAKLGYLALAPELYVRQGDVLGLNEPEEIYPIVSNVPDIQVMLDLDACVVWAVESGIGDLSRLGVTGFCWGGRMTWLYAAHNPNLKAGVAWYGRLENEVTEMQPQHPLDLADALRAPVLGLYGGQDHLIPNKLVQRMRKKLEKKKGKSVILTYPRSGHGFYADYRSSYQPKDAQSAWNELQAWFRKHEVIP